MKLEIIRIDLKTVNCYLVKAGDNFILFDTGGHTIFDKTYTNRCEDLMHELEKHGCKPGNLKLVILTHGDIDHVANAAYLREKYQIKIAMHAEDLQLVESLTLEKMMQSFRFRSIILKIIFQIMKNRIKKISGRILDDCKPFSPDILINEGDSLLEYGFNVKIIYIPGHTHGSIGALTENGDLIAGDIFIKIKKPSIAPNAVDFKLLAKSVNRLRTMNINTIYPGHGLPFKMNDLRLF